MSEFYDLVCDEMVASVKRLRNVEVENKQAVEQNGELSESASANYENLKRITEKLQVGHAFVVCAAYVCSAQT